MSMDSEDIKNCIREVLSERTSVDPEKHRAHHQSFDEFLPELRDFLAYRRVRMKQIQHRREIWLQVRNTAIGALVVSVVAAFIGALAWVGTVFVQVFLHWVHSSPPGGG